MVSVQNLAVYFGGTVLFEGLNFQVNAGDRIGLAGRNGAGKSTLMKILSGWINASEGDVARPREFKIGYLPQEFAHKSTKSIREETATAFAEMQRLAAELDRITHELQTRTDYESDAYSQLIEDLTSTQERFDVLEGSRTDEKLEKVLKGLGFSDEDMERRMADFSGGWQMRVELAKLLLTKPDLLLLDEPTNHLDIESIIWLEEFLKGYPGSIMMISHDRRFID
jgi:ATP-binding cassette subfamily F protein 3